MFICYFIPFLQSDFHLIDVIRILYHPYLNLFILSFFSFESSLLPITNVRLLSQMSHPAQCVTFVILPARFVIGCLNFSLLYLQQLFVVSNQSLLNY